MARRYRLPSVRGLPIEDVALQVDGRRKLRLSDIQLGLDLATLTGVAGIMNARTVILTVKRRPCELVAHAIGLNHSQLRGSLCHLSASKI